MVEIIKQRQNIKNLTTFLSTFKVDGPVYVPMLHDGIIESYLSRSNTVMCKPADRSFETLWKVLENKPQILSRFIEAYETEPETTAMLLEVMKISTNEIAKAYNLLSLCRRTSYETLIGGTLMNREDIFSPKYLTELEAYTPPFEIVDKEPINTFVFQDLTYLQDHEIKTLISRKKYLFVTNNKQHLCYFDGANCSSLDEYYLIWR
jgi:hypothetical protein|tara:strand:- start:5 stop:622 length:618 start_codon:yes stop_codon:yes gene_type:complete